MVKLEQINVIKTGSLISVNDSHYYDKSLSDAVFAAGIFCEIALSMRSQLILKKKNRVDKILRYHVPIWIIQRNEKMYFFPFDKKKKNEIVFVFPDQRKRKKTINELDIEDYIKQFDESVKGLYKKIKRSVKEKTYSFPGLIRSKKYKNTLEMNNIINILIKFNELIITKFDRINQFNTKNIGIFPSSDETLKSIYDPSSLISCIDNIDRIENDIREAIPFLKDTSSISYLSRFFLICDECIDVKEKRIDDLTNQLRKSLEAEKIRIQPEIYYCTDEAEKTKIEVLETLENDLNHIDQEFSGEIGKLKGIMNQVENEYQNWKNANEDDIYLLNDRLSQLGSNLNVLNSNYEIVLRNFKVTQFNASQGSINDSIKAQYYAKDLNDIQAALSRTNAAIYDINHSIAVLRQQEMNYMSSLETIQNEGDRIHNQYSQIHENRKAEARMNIEEIEDITNKEIESLRIHQYRMENEIEDQFSELKAYKENVENWKLKFSKNNTTLMEKIIEHKKKIDISLIQQGTFDDKQFNNALNLFFFPITKVFYTEKGESKTRIILPYNLKSEIRKKGAFSKECILVNEFDLGLEILKDIDLESYYCDDLTSNIEKGCSILRRRAIINEKQLKKIKKIVIS